MKTHVQKQKKQHSEKWSVQAIRYAVVAFSGFLADYLLLLLLYDVIGLHYLLAAAIAFIAGLVVNYLLGTSWVFNRNGMHRLLEILLFLLVSLAALGITELVMWLLTDIIFQLSPMLSKLIAGIITYFWNFLARRYLIYRRSA